MKCSNLIILTLFSVACGISKIDQIKTAGESYNRKRKCLTSGKICRGRKPYMCYRTMIVEVNDGCFRILTVREDEGTTEEELETGVKEVVGPLLQLSGEPGSGAEDVGVAGKGADPGGGRARRRFRSSMYRSISWSNLDSISST